MTWLLLLAGAIALVWIAIMSVCLAAARRMPQNRKGNRRIMRSTVVLLHRSGGLR